MTHGESCSPLHLTRPDGQRRRHLLPGARAHALDSSQAVGGRGQAKGGTPQGQGIRDRPTCILRAGDGAQPAAREKPCLCTRIGQRNKQGVVEVGCGGRKGEGGRRRRRRFEGGVGQNKGAHGPERVVVVGLPPPSKIGLDKAQPSETDPPASLLLGPLPAGWLCRWETPGRARRRPGLTAPRPGPGVGGLGGWGEQDQGDDAAHLPERASGQCGFSLLYAGVLTQHWHEGPLTDANRREGSPLRYWPVSAAARPCWPWPGWSSCRRA